MYSNMPGVCREYVSSFDDCILLDTPRYERLNGVSFLAFKYIFKFFFNTIFNKIKMYMNGNFSFIKI